MNQSSFFSLNWTDVKQALSLVIVTLVIQICGYIISVGDIFAISLHALANAAIIPCLVLIVSLLQTGFTTSDGRFLGTFTVK
jgi:cytochrome c oxidase subunit IV